MKKRILTLGIVLALVMAMVIPAAVFAAESDTTEGTGSIVAASIEVVAPSAFDFGTFAVGVNSCASAVDGSVTVTENSQSPTGYSVVARDLNQAGDTGKMIEPVGPTPLTNELTISDDDITYVAASTGITYAEASLTGVLALYAEQTIGGAETAGAYAITIEFAGSITF